MRQECIDTIETSTAPATELGPMGKSRCTYGQNRRSPAFKIARHMARTFTSTPPYAEPF